MMTTEKIKRLREQTGLPVMDLKKALEESGQDEQQALEILKAKGVAVAAGRQMRQTGQGLIVTYSHLNRIGVVVEVLCETDFVAKTDDFAALAKDMAMQVASMNPADEDELLAQVYIKDPGKTVQDVIHEVIAKTGENIRLGRFCRLAL